MSKKTVVAPVATKTTIAGSGPLLRFENQLYWHYALLVFLPFFVFIKTVSFEFIDFDDVSIIVNNSQLLGSIKNIGLAFTTDAFLSSHGDFYRPLQTVSYFLDALIGGERPLIYHLTNLIYHLLTVIAVYNLLRLLHIRNLSALFASLVFSVHPLLASAISWIPSRGDLLFTLFGLQLLINFIKFYRTGKVAWLLLSCFWFLLSIFCKETAVLLPALPLLYMLLLDGGKIRWKKSIPFFLACVASSLLFFWLRGKVVISLPPDFIVGIKPFMNNLPAIPIFFGKFFVPIGLSTMPLFNSVAVVIGFLLLAIGLWMVIQSAKKKDWLVPFGFVWFILFIVPPLFFKLYYSKYLLEYYEHRSYMPVVGLIVILAFMLDKVSRDAKAYVGVPVAAILVLTFIASSHSDDFKNSMAFFGRAAELDNPGAANKRGELYYGQKDVNSALADFERAIDVSGGNYPPAFYNRGNIRTSQVKDYKAADEDYSKALALDTNYVEAYIGRASERILNADFVGAINDLDRAEKLDNSNASIFYTRAKAFTSATRFKEAEALFTKAINMDSTAAEVFNDRAFVRYRLKDYEGALVDCDKAIALFPQFLNAYYNKGMIFYETNRTKDAIAAFDITLSLANNFYFGYFYRGMAKRQNKDMKGACEDWHQSVKLGFKQAEDTIRAYCK